MSENNENSRTKHLLAIVVILLVAVLGVGAYYFKSISGTLLIDFKGMSQEEVLSWQKENKLNEEQFVFTYEYDEEAEKDTVITQDPVGGTTVSRKETITITLSDGKDPGVEITLIDFTDMSQTNLMAWFEENGFTDVSYVYEPNETIDANKFIGISPEAESLKRNESITVRISSGSEESDTEVLVPDFSTYTRTNMQAWGSTNQITIQFLTESSDTVAKGGFIRQSINAGESVKMGSRITITLSSGKAITVTSQVGSSRSVGEQWATSNNLKTKIITVYSADAESGIITGQSPTNGTVSEGDTITFHVSIGKVSLDDYTGSTQSAFTAYVNELNTQHNNSANISISIKQVESTEAAGMILSQSVSGLVNPGTSVSIEVATAKQYNITSQQGQSEENFTTYLTSNQMERGNRTEAYNDIEAGRIISNDTGTYPAGTKINYQVSLGPWSPDSSLYQPGQDISRIQSAVNEANTKGAGWSVSYTNETSDTYNTNQIIACSVSGKTISCRVSSGLETSVPNVVGKSYTEAQTILENAGFTVELQNIGYHNDYEAGIVFAQSITGNATPGTRVMIRYSDGPEPIQMATLPNIAGYLGIYADRSYSENVAQMTSLFRNAGFTNINIIAVPTGGDSGGNNQNGIESISPTPDGSTIPADTQITIRIYQPDN